MYDPQHSPPTFGGHTREQRRHQRRLTFWASAAMFGALVLLIGGCVLVAGVFVPAVRDLADLRDPTGPPPVQPTVEQDAMPTRPINLAEDFSPPAMRWDQSLATVRDGTYEIQLDPPNTDRYGLFLGAQRVLNVDVAVDVRQTAGDPQSAAYGIRFRQQGPRSYLFFAISGTGYYRLVRVQDDVYTELVPWTADERITTGDNAVNRLRLVADDEQLTGYINGEQVFAAEDDSPQAGQFTLGAATFDVGGLVVRFDNVAGDVDGTPIAEDFAQASAGTWSLGGAQLVDGSYELQVGAGLNSWQHPLPEGSTAVQNFRASVDITPVEVGDDTGYGFIFGDTGNFSFYSLLITTNGFLTITQNTPDGGSTLVPPQPVDALVTGAGNTNTLALEVRNDTTLVVTINGEELPPLEAAQPFERGMVGVIVSSGSEGPVRVQFDNYELREVLGNDDA